MKSPLPRVAVVGRGRLGTALVQAFRTAGVTVDGPMGREADPVAADLVLLCVPDREIQAAAERLSAREGLIVGHCSGITSLDVLEGWEACGLHPLLTVYPGTEPAAFVGATAAVAGTTPRAHRAAEQLAAQLGMVPVTVADAERPAYHAAASIASNFLLTVEDLAERMAASAGISRDQLVPLVRAAVDNWARDGGAVALTGPVARGDEETIARQRRAVTDHSPHDVELFDALVAATRRLAVGEGDL